MSTLNSQQINPGNRVDFSRIRKYGGGGVPPIPGEDETAVMYDFDSFFLNYDGLDPSTLQAPSNFDPANRDADLSNYTGFGQSVVTSIKGSDAPQETPYYKYLLWLDKQLIRMNLPEYAGQSSVFFTDLTLSQLLEDWENRFNQVRSSTNYGPWDLLPGRGGSASMGDVTVVAPRITKYEGRPADYISDGTYRIPYPIPEYEPGKWTDWAHLAGIHANNALGHARDYELATKLKYPKYSTTDRNAMLTNGYTERMLNEKAMAELRSRAASLASKTSSLEHADAIVANAEQLALQGEVRNNEIMADRYHKSLSDLLNIADYNNEARNEAANYNRKVNAAAFNDMLNNKRQLFKNITADQNDLINKMDESYNKYMAAEKTNKRIYNENVNNFLYGVAKNEAYTEYQNTLRNAVASADRTAGVYLSTIVETIIRNAANEQILAILSKEDIQTLLSATPEQQVKIVRRCVSPLERLGLQVLKWLNAYDAVAQEAEAAYYRKIQEETAKLGYANLYGRGFYSSAPGLNEEGLDKNTSTIFGLGSAYVPMSKKGGPIDYRWERYIEYRRNQSKDSDKKVADESKRLTDKLNRDLEALDKETLLLLRAIFK